MAEQTKDQTQYRKAREEFDGLQIEEKAIFLVEATFSMLARGIESIGDLFSEQISKVYEEDGEDEELPEKPAPRKSQTRKKTANSSRKRSSGAKSTPKTKTDEAE